MYLYGSFYGINLCYIVYFKDYILLGGFGY